MHIYIPICPCLVPEEMALCFGRVSAHIAFDFESTMWGDACSSAQVPGLSCVVYVESLVLSDKAKKVFEKLGLKLSCLYPDFVRSKFPTRNMVSIAVKTIIDPFLCRLAKSMFRVNRPLNKPKMVFYGEQKFFCQSFRDKNCFPSCVTFFHNYRNLPLNAYIFFVDSG